MGLKTGSIKKKFALVLAFLLVAAPALAVNPPQGTTANYAVLANTTITNTGTSVLSCNLALSPGSSVTGFPPGTVIGVQDD